MNISHFLLKLFIFALGALTLNVNAATCTPTNVLYIQDGIINIPCIKVNGEQINATFKLISTKPEHIWALQKFRPANENISGLHADYSIHNKYLNIPLLKSIDGRLWKPELKHIEQATLEGKYLFKLNNVLLLDPTKNISYFIIKVGDSNTPFPIPRRTNKVDICHKAKTKSISQAAVSAHLKHGDTLGACNAPDLTAVLKIKRVEIFTKNNGIINLDISGDLDLLKVIDGESQLLGEIVLPADTYIEQVRLILDTGSYVIKEGEQYALTVPSGEQTGLKIIGDWQLVGGQMTEIQLDFSLGDVRFIPGLNEYRMKPTIKVAGVTNGDLPIDDDGGIILPGEGEPFILNVGAGFTLEVPADAHFAPEILHGEEHVLGGLAAQYDLKPDGTQFYKPTTLTINYDKSEIDPDFSEENIVILHDEKPIPTFVDTENNIAIAQLEHFTCIAVTPVHSCNFIDNAWADAGAKKLCLIGLLKGYKEDNGWSYRPWNNDENKTANATVHHALKVFLAGSSYGSCKRYNYADRAKERNAINADAISQGITVETLKTLSNADTNVWNHIITRESAFFLVAKLFFNYTGTIDSVINKLVSKGVVTKDDEGDYRLDSGLNRAEMAKLASRAIDAAKTKEKIVLVGGLLFSRLKECGSSNCTDLNYLLRKDKLGGELDLYVDTITTSDIHEFSWSRDAITHQENNPYGTNTLKDKFQNWFHEEVCKNHETCYVSFIAHSWGTVIVADFIASMLEDTSIKIRTVVTYGSPVTGAQIALNTDPFWEIAVNKVLGNNNKIDGTFGKWINVVNPNDLIAWFIPGTENVDQLGASLGHARLPELFPVNNSELDPKYAVTSVIRICGGTGNCVTQPVAIIASIGAYKIR